MNKKTRKEYLKTLHTDKFFNHALSLLTNAEEKEKIKAFAEDVFIQLLEGSRTIEKITNEHPEKLAAVAEGRISKDKEPKITKDK